MWCMVCISVYAVYFVDVSMYAWCVCGMCEWCMCAA